jgi:hypothetical protein
MKLRQWEEGLSFQHAAFTSHTVGHPFGIVNHSATPPFPSLSYLFKASSGKKMVVGFIMASRFQLTENKTDNSMAYA